MYTAKSYLFNIDNCNNLPLQQYAFKRFPRLLGQGYILTVTQKYRLCN